ncbi:hypothetical protein FRB96_003005 [Tulasnella sp. 330]|nr:hypothetical protein FRB96_003005 [Tulasnella sp. 330]
MTNFALQSIFEGTLNGVTASACRVGTKKNKGDTDALALYIAEITERSIRREISSSDNGVIHDALIINIIRWQQHGYSFKIIKAPKLDPFFRDVPMKLRDSTREFTFLIALKYKDDRLELATFDAMTGSILSLLWRPLRILTIANALDIAIHVAAVIHPITPTTTQYKSRNQNVLH